MQKEYNSMIYMGCTQKLAKEFKDRLSTEEVTVRNGIHGWHANLYSFFRRKSVLVINDETRFSVFLPGLRKAEFQNFEDIFRKRLRQELTHSGVSQGKSAEFLLSLGSMTFGKTHSRSVLSTMKQMAFSLEILLKRLGHLPENDDELTWLNHSINETPCRAKGRKEYFIPAEEIHQFSKI